MSIEESQQPSRSKSFVIGGAGHRILPAEHSGLQRAIHRALESILAERAGDPAPPRLVISVAEGADRLIIEAAQDLGIPYTCVLPCSRDCFEEDFDDAHSIEEFRRILSQADDVVQPLESPGEKVSGYLWTNDYILDRSDMLFAVWDGKSGDAPAGTGDTIGKASHRSIPILWVSSEPPHESSRLHELAVGR